MYTLRSSEVNGGVWSGSRGLLYGKIGTHLKYTVVVKWTLNCLIA